MPENENEPSSWPAGSFHFLRGANQTEVAALNAAATHAADQSSGTDQALGLTGIVGAVELETRTDVTAPEADVSGGE